MGTKGKLASVCLGLAITISSFGTTYASILDREQSNSGRDSIGHELRLLEKAKEKGITVEELKKILEQKKAEMKAEKKAKLEEEARNKGITVEELIKQKKAEHKAKLEKEAQDKGITVEELIKQKKADR